MFKDELNCSVAFDDEADIALTCSASGVHLGEGDLPFPRSPSAPRPEIRSSVFRIHCVGGSSRGKGGRRLSRCGGCLPGLHKKGLNTFLGSPGLKVIRGGVRLLILAIGGISAENAGEVMASGADGVAVILAILGTEDVGRATRELLEALRGK